MEAVLHNQETRLHCIGQLLIINNMTLCHRGSDGSKKRFKVCHPVQPQPPRGPEIPPFIGFTTKTSDYYKAAVLGPFLS